MPISADTIKNNKQSTCCYILPSLTCRCLLHCVLLNRCMVCMPTLTSARTSRRPTSCWTACWLPRAAPAAVAAAVVAAVAAAGSLCCCRWPLSWMESCGSHLTMKQRNTSESILLGPLLGLCSSCQHACARLGLLHSNLSPCKDLLAAAEPAGRGLCLNI